MLTISAAPHLKSNLSTPRLMYDVVIALLPALAVALYYYGLGALTVVLISVLGCVLIEWLVQKFVMKIPITIYDGSAAVTGLLLSFNLPSNLHPGIILLGCLVAIGVAKLSFGGLGSNPFNPALVGRVFLLISFPAQLTTWPVPEVLSTHYTDALTGATPLSLMQQGNVEGLSLFSMFMGNIGGSLGEISVAALLLGFIYLLIRGVISWHIPASILLTVAIFTSLLHWYDPTHYVPALYHLFAGGLMLGAIFMATDYVTSPMSKVGMLVYGVGIGILTVVIRCFGSFPEGMSFAILLMNAATPLINKYIRPRVFGL